MQIVDFRFKSSWSGGLFLEIKIKVSDGPPDCNGMPTYLSGDYWIDAKEKHLNEIYKQLSLKELLK